MTLNLTTVALVIFATTATLVAVVAADCAIALLVNYTQRKTRKKPTVADGAKLTMGRYLEAVRVHKLSAHAVLIADGWHPNVISAKANKATLRGYTEYGTSPALPWITDKGKAFLEADRG